MLDKLSLQNIIIDYKKSLEKSKEKIDLNTKSILDNNNIKKIRNKLNSNNTTSKTTPKAAGVVLLLLIIIIALYIYALVLLVKNWNKLSNIVRFVGVLGLLPNMPIGPVITIIVVKISLASNNTK